MLLRIIAIISILVSGVWATETEVVITREDYANANLWNSLQDNSDVTHLKIHVLDDYTERSHCVNFANVVHQGLRNKPNLKKLEIIGDFDARLWWQSDLVSSETDMKWLWNLEEFIINGNLTGEVGIGLAHRWHGDLESAKTKNLKRFQITGIGHEIALDLFPQ